MSVLEYALVNYRWVFVVFFLMPLSVLFDIFYHLRNWIIFNLNSAPERHDERVKYVQKQVLYVEAVEIPDFKCRLKLYVYLSSR